MDAFKALSWFDQTMVSLVLLAVFWTVVRPLWKLGDALDAYAKKTEAETKSLTGRAALKGVETSTTPKQDGSHE